MQKEVSALPVGRGRGWSHTFCYMLTYTQDEKYSYVATKDLYSNQYFDGTVVIFYRLHELTVK